jgi:hypothetical protein
MNDFQNTVFDVFTFGFNAYSSMGGFGATLLLIALVSFTVIERRTALADYEKARVKYEALTPEAQLHADYPSRLYFTTNANRNIALAWLVFGVGYWMGIV